MERRSPGSNFRRSLSVRSRLRGRPLRTAPGTSLKAFQGECTCVTCWIWFILSVACRQFQVTEKAQEWAGSIVRSCCRHGVNSLLRDVLRAGSQIEVSVHSNLTMGRPDVLGRRPQPRPNLQVCRLQNVTPSIPLTSRQASVR